MTRAILFALGTGTALVAAAGAWLWSAQKGLLPAALVPTPALLPLDENMRLSPNFVLGEFTRSTTATQLGLPNTPNSAQLENLRKLAVEVLEPVRGVVGAPLRITSGFRTPELNAALGNAGYAASDTSQHMEGNAADFTPIGVSAQVAFDRIRPHLASWDVDQLILYATHIHIGRKANAPRRMVGVSDPVTKRISWLPNA